MVPHPSDRGGGPTRRGDERRVLAELRVPSEPGNERRVTEEIAGVARDLLSPERLERLKTAVAEATMNAMEHGNRYRAEAPVVVEAFASEEDLLVRITDRGGSPVPSPESRVPDLEAKLEGLQTPRGWGLFLIENMVDEMRVTGDEEHHTIELILRLGGEEIDPEGGRR